MVCHVGVVGVNTRARRLILPGFAAAPHARVVAVCSRSRAKAEEAAGDVGASAFDDYAAMLRHPDLDTVFLNTPPEQHHPMALAAIRAGKRVICEKPLAATLEEATELAEVAAAAGAQTVVNFTYRSLPAHRYVARLLADGAIGRLLGFDVGFWQARELLGPRAGRALLDVGSHVFDTLLWWAGAANAGEARRVCARSAPVGLPNDATSGGGGEARTWAGVVELTTGTVGSFACSRATPGYRNAMAAMLRGTHGTIRLEFDTDTASVHLAQLGSGSPEGTWQTLPIPDDLAVSYTAFPAYHFDRLARAALGQEAFSDFADGWRTQRLIAVAEEADRSERWILVAP